MTTSNRDREVCDAAPEVHWTPDFFWDLSDEEKGFFAYIYCLDRRKQLATRKFIAHFNPTRVRAMLDERDALLREAELAKQIFGWTRHPNRGVEGYEEYARLRDAREGKG